MPFLFLLNPVYNLSREDKTAVVVGVCEQGVDSKSISFNQLLAVKPD
jgi:hypothetical protein